MAYKCPKCGKESDQKENCPDCNVEVVEKEVAEVEKEEAAS